MNYPSDISVSTVGNRAQRRYGGEQQQQQDGSCATMKETTDLVLADLLDHSHFFDENPSRALPTFDPSEVEIGDVLGVGEFGIVSEVSCLRIVVDDDDNNTNNNCHCPPTEEDTEEAPSVPPPPPPASSPLPPRLPPTRPSLLPHTTSPPHSIIVTKRNNNNNASSPHHRRNRTGSSVTFAEESKLIGGESRTEVTERLFEGSGVSDFEDDEDDHDDDDDDDYELEFSTSEDDDDDDEEQVNVNETTTTTEMNTCKWRMATHSQRNGIARYAIKRLRSSGIEKHLLTDAAIDLACEAKFLASISHSNIVRLRGTVGEPGHANFAIVMDRLTSTLDEKIPEWKNRQKTHSGMLGLGVFRRSRDDQGLADLFGDRLLAAFDIARAMRHLHSKRIIYRDLKPENIGFDVCGMVRIFDFGLAKELKRKDLVEEPDSYDATGLTGSRRYMAPECVRCLPYGFSADVYSFCILFWQIFALKTPFPNYDSRKHFDLVVVKGKRPSRLGDLPSLLQKMMENGWSEKPSRRPKFKQICQQLQAEILDFRAAAGETSGSISDRSAHLMNRSLMSLYNTSDD